MRLPYMHSTYITKDEKAVYSKYVMIARLQRYYRLVYKGILCFYFGKDFSPPKNGIPMTTFNKKL